VACFFERLWDRPASGLSEHRKALVLNFAGFGLRAVGRLREAAAPMEAGLGLDVGREDWENAAIAAGTLSELYLTLGDLAKAVGYGRRSTEYADKTGDGLQRRSKRTTLADALHQAGEVAEAKRLFEEAERMQRENQPQYQHLYSVWGYRYCDLLVSLGEYGAVKERGRYALAVVIKGTRTLLDIALNKLSVGSCFAGASEDLDGPAREESLGEARRWLDEAVEGLRKAGQQQELPRGLLARGGVLEDSGGSEKQSRGSGEQGSKRARVEDQGAWGFGGGA
jgi:tetratricopeptide (TPR) repeat protein